MDFNGDDEDAVSVTSVASSVRPTVVRFEDLVHRGLLAANSSSASAMRSSRKKYDKFANSYQLPVFDDLEVSNDGHVNSVDEWIGLFTSFLVEMEPELRAQTHMNTLSSVQNQLGEKGFNLDKNKTRRCFTFIKKNCERGRKGLNADYIKSAELLRLCEHLFEVGTVVSVQDRCLLAFDWTTIGRVSEVSNLKFSDISLYTHRNRQCLRVSGSGS